MSLRTSSSVLHPHLRLNQQPYNHPFPGISINRIHLLQMRTFNVSCKKFVDLGNNTFWSAYLLISIELPWQKIDGSYMVFDRRVSFGYHISCINHPLSGVQWMRRNIGRGFNKRSNNRRFTHQSGIHPGIQ
jgi:hypothetical protein